jgi:CheY-like chemotaxis protein
MREIHRLSQAASMGVRLIKGWHLAKAGIALTSDVVTSAYGMAAALVKQVPHVIISDLTMPGFDGWDAFRVGQEFARGVPFILYSGLSDRRDPANCRRSRRLRMRR